MACVPRPREEKVGRMKRDVRVRMEPSGEVREGSGGLK